MLNSVAQRRHQHYSRLLGRSSYSLLEIGCGAAGLGPGFVSAGVDYSGLDIDPRPIEAAKARGVENLHVGDFMGFSSQRKFDVIFMTQVLEHITHPREMIKRIHDSLSPGGVIHLDVPNQRTLAGTPSRLGRGMGTRLGAIDYPHHSIAYTAEPLAQLLREDFDAEVFSATPNHPVWGQAGVPGPVARAYFACQRVLGGRSLVVAVGRAKNWP